MFTQMPPSGEIDSVLLLHLVQQIKCTQGQRKQATLNVCYGACVWPVTESSEGTVQSFYTPPVGVGCEH